MFIYFTFVIVLYLLLRIKDSNTIWYLLLSFIFFTNNLPTTFPHFTQLPDMQPNTVRANSMWQKSHYVHIKQILFSSFKEDVGYYIFIICEVSMKVLVSWCPLVRINDSTTIWYSLLPLIFFTNKLLTTFPHFTQRTPDIVHFIPTTTHSFMPGTPWLLHIFYVLLNWYIAELVYHSSLETRRSEASNYRSVYSSKGSI